MKNIFSIENCGCKTIEKGVILGHFGPRNSEKREFALVAAVLGKTRIKPLLVPRFRGRVTLP